MKAATEKLTHRLNGDKRRKQSAAYQQRRRSARYSVPDPSAQHHYGVTAQQPDISRDELKVLCAEYYDREIVVNSDEAGKIEMETRRQSDSVLWYHHRRVRLTASNFGKVAKRRPTTPVANTVKTLLYSRSVDTKAVRWGHTHEDDARQAYLQSLQISDGRAAVSTSGLVVDVTEPCLASSPDGLVHIPGSPEPHGVVELKCPYTAAERGLTPHEAAQSLKTFLCKRTDDGSLQLKRNHDYYHQVQGLLAITRRPWCDFVVWTPKGMSVERIRFDPVFWEDTQPKLVRFHRESILPELALPRYTSGQAIREPGEQQSSVAVAEP